MRAPALASALALACLLGSGAPAAAEGAAPPARQGSLSLRIEQPDRGLETWRALRLEFGTVPRNWQRGWQLAAVSEERFGTRDHGIEAGMTLPLDERWLLQTEAGLAPDADFLPRHYADIRLARRFEGGTLASIGWRGARYREQRADRALLGLEHYAGDWRLAWTGSLVRVDGRHAPGHELALDRYYGERNSIGARLARGRELVPLPGGSRVFDEVRSAAVVGRHWIGPRWALQWSAGYVDQAALYDRRWVQLGLQHAW